MCQPCVEETWHLALSKVAAEGHEEGVITGGKGYGKLTSTAIVQLQNYYGRAIWSHPIDLEGMRNAVFASLLHALSTDDHCPAGASSWCFFRRAVAKDERPGPYKDNVDTPRTRKICHFVKPVYVRMGDVNLLCRCCLRVKTHNPNESLHSIIWRKCLKRDFLGKLRVKAGTAIAVIEFNQGAEKSVSEITTALGFQLVYAQVKLTRSKDNENIAMTERNSDVQDKKNRECRHLHRIRQQDMLTEAEGGPSYASGEF